MPPSFSTLKARAKGNDPAAGPDPVIEAAKELPRIDLCRCSGIEQRVELVTRSVKRIVKDGPKAAANKEDEKMYTVYLFTVTDEHQSTWTVAKRFSEIRDFKQSLVRSGADIVKGWELPSKVPLKKSQKKMNEATIAERKQTLETFLSLSVSFFGKHPVVKKFLASNENRARLDEYRPAEERGLGMMQGGEEAFAGGYPGEQTAYGAADQQAAGGMTSSPGEGLFQSAQMAGSQSDADYELALALSRSESGGPGPGMAERALAAGQGNEEDVMRNLMAQSEAEEAARQEMAQREQAQYDQALRASQGLAQPLFFEGGPQQDDDEDERPLQRQSPAFSGDPTGRMAVVTVDAPATNAAALPVQTGDVVEVVSVASAHWWTVRLGDRQGFVSPKALQVLTDGAAPPAAAAPAAATAGSSRNFLMMIAPNQYVPIGRKLKISCADMPSLLQEISEQLGLGGAIVLATAVNESTAPSPYQSFAEVPEKAKVQVWPANMFQSAPAPALAPARDFLLMVAPNQLVPVGRKLKVTASSLDEMLNQVGTQVGLSFPVHIAPAVGPGGTPNPIASLDEMQAKMKIQVWQSTAAAAAPISEGLPPQQQDSGGSFYDEATQRRISMTKEFTKLREDITTTCDGTDDARMMDELMAAEEPDMQAAEAAEARARAQAQAEQQAATEEQHARAMAAQQQEQARAMAEAEQQRQAAAAESARQDDARRAELARQEEETRRRVVEEQAAIAAAEDAKRQAEQDAARIALEAEKVRIAEQQEAARVAQEAAQKERAAMDAERERLGVQAKALEEQKAAAAAAAAAAPKTPDYTATSSSAAGLSGMRTSQLQERLQALSARDPRLGVEMVLSKSPKSTKEQAMKALQESAGDVDKALVILSSAAPAASGAPAESGEMRSFVLMVTPSDLVKANRMLRVQASSLLEMKGILAEKLSVDLPAEGAADVSMMEPGRKEPTFIHSLDDLPLKAKVQLWSAGTDPNPPAAAAAGGGVGGTAYTLTVTQSPGIAPEGTVIRVSGTDLDGLHAAIGAQLGKGSLQLLHFDPDFDEFCRPVSQFSITKAAIQTTCYRSSFISCRDFLLIALLRYRWLWTMSRQNARSSLCCRKGVKFVA